MRLVRSMKGYDLSEHDKQTCNMVIEEIENFVNEICEYPPTSLLGKRQVNWVKKKYWIN